MSVVTVLLLSVLSLSGSSSGSPTLVVQVVEPGWTPLPGVAVTVRQVSSCGTSGRGVGDALVKRTDEQGHSSFEVADDRRYRIETKGEGGFLPASICVRLFKLGPKTPTAYVQLRVRLEKTSVTVTQK